jgi:hypothetical protein
VCHRTVSGAPGDSALNSSASGIFRSRHAIIHRTVRCTPDSVPCSKRTRLWNLAASGIRNPLLRYNSPDMSGVHRTVRCNNGATTTSAPTTTCGHIKCAPAHAEVRHAHAGAPDTLQYMSGAPPDIQAGPASELQLSEPNGFGDVVGAPDMSGVHRTVRCIMRQTAPPNG